MAKIVDVGTGESLPIWSEHVKKRVVSRKKNARPNFGATNMIIGVGFKFWAHKRNHIGGY